MKFLSNSRGDAFIMALILIGILGFVFTGVQVLQDSSKKRVQNLKVRTWLTSTELRVRQALMQPEAYLGCTSSATGASTGCTLNTAFLKGYEFVPQQGGSCNGSQCGVRVSNWAFNNTTREVTSTISFEGAIDAKDTTLRMKVPEEILQAASFFCPSLNPATPIFKGVDSQTGRVICAPIVQCPTGSYMTGVRSDTLNSICSNFPTGSATCAVTEHIASFSWQGTIFSRTCATRPDPVMPTGGGGGAVVPTAAGCGSVKNTCTSGSFVDQADTTAEYRWSCVSAAGSQSCSASKKICTPLAVSFMQNGINKGKDHCSRDIFYQKTVSNPYAGRALFEINIRGVDDTLFIDGIEIHANQFTDFNGGTYACNAPHADYFSKTVGGGQAITLAVADNHGGMSSLDATVCFTELE